jgi:hypothetical protein
MFPPRSASFRVNPGESSVEMALKWRWAEKTS